jgi:hypothetical protein
MFALTYTITAEEINNNTETLDDIMAHDKGVTVD